MKARSTALLAMAGLGAVLGASSAAAAFTVSPTMQAPTVVEDVACRITRLRTVLPGGRVILSQRADLRLADSASRSALPGDA